MPAPEPPSLRLTGAEVLTPDGLTREALSIAGGVIARGGGREVDLGGFVVLPGIVDLHGDGFERHMAPRRGALTDPAAGLDALEAELGANGITTATLAQFWSWEGGMRGPEFAETLCAALAVHPVLADLRVQLRLELGCFESFEAALALVDGAGIRQVVFNDHLPHDRLAAGRRIPRLEGQALKSGRSPADHKALLERLHHGIGQARAALPRLCADLTARGVLLGSHDDPTPAARAGWRALGARLSEFPLSREVAEAARTAGDAVVLGAPNVMRGGSHRKRGARAVDLLREGLCDALASDYHYPAPAGAARRLLSEGWSLARAWELVSAGPARVLGLGDRGRIAPGLRADLVVTDPHLGRVHATFAAGRPIWMAGPVAERFLR